MPQVSFSELNELIGSAGIGSVAMLGIALVLDALTPLYALIESNAQSQTWAYFVVVPLFVFSYVAGVLCVALGKVMRRGLFPCPKTSMDFRQIEEPLLNIVSIEYRNHVRKTDILDGTAPAFLILAVGMAFESIAFNLPLFGVIVVTLAVLTSALSLWIAHRTETDFRTFVEDTSGSV